LDVMSVGVALAWATEALERAIVSEDETIVPLQFGNAKNYEKAVLHMARGTNEFYRLLNQGTLKAAVHFGGESFACVLGQEMAGYATGEVFYTSQALGLRHSHLDSGGYDYDQKHDEQDVDKAIAFLVEDERDRILLTSMVACLFARKVYTVDLLADCLETIGYRNLAADMEATAKTVQQLRWQNRLDTGFLPEKVTIPQRYGEVATLKGRTDEVYLKELQRAYAEKIIAMGKPQKA